MKHWASKYIGLPYEPGARGPREVDCWGMMRMVYQERFGIELPLYPGISERNKALQLQVIREGVARDWIEVCSPCEGYGVGMGNMGLEIHHIGLCLLVDGQWRVLHCSQSIETVAEPLKALRKRMRMLQFYKHRSWPT